VHLVACKYRLQDLGDGSHSEGANTRTSCFGNGNNIADLIIGSGDGDGNGNNVARTICIHCCIRSGTRTTGKIHGKTSLRSRKGQTGTVGVGGCDTSNQLTASVLVQLNNIGTITHDLRLPANDRASLDGFGVPGKGAVTIHGLNGADRAHASKLDPKAIGHGVLLGDTHHLVTSILEVGHASKGNAPGLGGSHRLDEALCLVIIGDDVFGVGVSFQRSVGQAKKAERIVGAVHCHCNGSSADRKYARSVGNLLSRSNNSSGVNEVAGTSANTTGDTSKGYINGRRSQGNDVNIIPEGSREVCHSRFRERGLSER